MNRRYSKIKLGHTSNSRSMDFSDLQSFHEHLAKPIEEPIPPNSQLANFQIKKPDSSSQRQQQQVEVVVVEEEESNNGGRNYRLTRNGSVKLSKTGSKRFNLKQLESSSPRGGSSVESVVKRAFSMRRSSSVSEKYCRIHDQYVTLSSPLDDINDDDPDIIDIKNKKKKHVHVSGRFFKACKRILGI